MKRGTSDSKAIPRATSDAQCDACPLQFHCPLPTLVKGSMGLGTRPVLQTRYRAGQHIVNEGEPVTGLHVLCDGWATVTKSVGMEQDDCTLYVVGAGGLLDVSDNLAASQIYSGTVKSLTNSTVAFVRSDELARRLETDQTFSGKFLRLIAKQLRALEKQYIVRFSQDVAGRIIHVLLEFARPYGLERSKAVTLPMKLSRSSLAEIVGSTPETVSRAISWLKQQAHVLETHQETIIPDIERLRALIRPSA
jgi:CRP/FNR family transcriptional regulator